MNISQFIQRQLYTCPEIDKNDTLRFPEPEPEQLMAMESIYREDMTLAYVFPFARTAASGEPYIEIFIWDCMQQPHPCGRWIICPGYRMTQEDEETFLTCLHLPLAVHTGMMKQFIIDVQQVFADWHLDDYTPGRPGLILEHLYFASHPSGPKEILYKAQLGLIAWHLERIPGCDLIGTTPETIIGRGLPLKLLRMLNRREFITNLLSEEDMLRCCAVYETYAGCIDPKTITRGQWRYLESLCLPDGLFYGKAFSRALYERLKAPGSEHTLSDYKEFLILRDKLSGIRKMKLPRTEDVGAAVLSLKKACRFLQANPELEGMFRRRKKRSQYEYRDDDYIVTMPGKPMDICVEAISQGNCLMEYADRHADGETTILFLRKACAPDMPYVTLEVRDWQVTQVYARFNMPPPVEVYTFLEKYARRNWLYFNPYQVIMEACDEIDPDDWDSGLLNYAEAYLRRNRAFSFDWPTDDGRYIQLTLGGCKANIHI